MMFCNSDLREWIFGEVEDQSPRTTKKLGSGDDPRDLLECGSTIHKR